MIAEQTVKAMLTAGVKHVVFIAAIGIYNEVPDIFGLWNKQMIGPIPNAIKKLQASLRDHTILRPTWYTNNDEIDYKITQNDQPVTGTEISRKSVTDLVVKLIEDPKLHVNDSLGMEKAGTEADKPVFMN